MLAISSVLRRSIERRDQRRSTDPMQGAKAATPPRQTPRPECFGGQRVSLDALTAGAGKRDATTFRTSRAIQPNRVSRRKRDNRGLYGIGVIIPDQGA
jgi:hypothetical protein